MTRPNSTRARKAPSRPAPSPLSTSAAPKADDPATWPVIWRVTAPAAGSYNHDIVFLECEDEVDAREHLQAVRASGFPARLERVSCGPLPCDARTALMALRAENPQNPGARMREVLGAWEGRS